MIRHIDGKHNGMTTEELFGFIEELEDKLHRRNVQIADLKQQIEELKKHSPTLMSLLEKIRDNKEELAECEKEVIDEISNA